MAISKKKMTGKPAMKKAQDGNKLKKMPMGNDAKQSRIDSTMKAETQKMQNTINNRLKQKFKDDFGVKRDTTMKKNGGKVKK
jgi:hypothetical protein